MDATVHELLDPALTCWEECDKVEQGFRVMCEASEDGTYPCFSLSPTEGFTIYAPAGMDDYYAGNLTPARTFPVDSPEYAFARPYVERIWTNRQGDY